MRPTSPPGRGRGFTLVEVLVALFVMAVLAAMAWRGLETILRSRDISRDAVDRTMRLATVVAQWEQDLAVLYGDAPVPTLACNARSVRLVRYSGSAAGGTGAVRLVTWTLDGSTLKRWVSEPVSRIGELQEAWLRSQQLLGSEPEQMKLLEGLAGWQVYFNRGGSWSNCESTGDIVQPPQSATAPASAASGAAAAPREALPGGVRLVLQWPERTLTRDIEIPPSP